MTQKIKSSPPQTLSKSQLTIMKYPWTLSLVASFCALTMPCATAGMAPSDDSMIDSTVSEAMHAVKNPSAKAQSAPAYPVSLTGPNRIAVTDKKITNAIYEVSQLEVQTDAITGQVFVFPKTQDPIALFLTTEDKETYALTLMPQAIRSQEIVLGLISKPTLKSQPYPQATFKEAIESAPDIDLKVTRLIRALARNELPDGFHASNRCGKFCLKSLTSETLIGKVLIHKNSGKQNVTLEEKFFYQKGVLAVAIEKASLAPGELTHVYTVEKNSSHHWGDFQ